MEEQRIILSLLVDNTSGVLTRIAGLFARRGYNIDSLTVGVTTNPKISRMTIASRGDENVLRLITAQLEKQEDVRDIKVLRPEASVSRELILVKVLANQDNRNDILNIANVFRAKTIDVQKDSMIIELTGSRPKLKAMLELLEDYERRKNVSVGVTCNEKTLSQTFSKSRRRISDRIRPGLTNIMCLTAGNTR